MSALSFEIVKKIPGHLGRAGVLTTPHGAIETPAFVAVGTKGTIKALTPEQLKTLGSQIVLANTYHLYLQPGDSVVAEGGGLHSFMNWQGPTMTDSGGFQVFSLGDAFGKRVSKFVEEARATEEGLAVFDDELATQHGRLAIVDDEGVSFTSHIDGSLHRFTPERSIEIQHKLGADIMFAFDEFKAPTAPYEEHKEAMERTHRWAERSLKAHRQNMDAQKRQGLFGIVQGGRFEELRRESARNVSALDFDGFGIGGSFSKEDMGTAVRWVCEELPDERPRHLLGIGEPEDLREGIENGADLFDCVAPTRIARTGQVYTEAGKINLHNEKFVRDFSPIDRACSCYTCRHYTKAYVAHLFRAQEILGATLASIHNLHFLISFVEGLRAAILEERF